jgi:bacterioferritin-associated ferredoxin
MYVCLCHSITDKDLQEAIGTNKNPNIKDLCTKLGIGSDCGACLQTAMSVLTQDRPQQATNLTTIRPSKRIKP